VQPHVHVSILVSFGKGRCAEAALGEAEVAEAEVVDPEVAEVAKEVAAEVKLSDSKDDI